MRNEKDDIGALEGPPERLWHLLMVLAVLIMAFIMVAASAWLSEAEAHDAPPSRKQPTGWSYDFTCCSATDCSQARDGDILATPQGWRVAATGEVIPYDDSRIKHSKDEYFHRCVPGGNESAPRSLCVYVPEFAG